MNKLIKHLNETNIGHYMSHIEPKQVKYSSGSGLFTVFLTVSSQQ